MEKYIGVVEDPRSEEAKALDYKHEDLASAGAVTLDWREKTDDEWKKYLIRNQDGSSACVAFATAKLLGIHEVKEGRTFTNLSPKFIYTRRANYPEGGMWLPDALSIACKSGACEETLLNSEDKNESFMNDKGQETPTCREDAVLYKGNFYLEIQSRTIDNIAQVIEQGYGVLLGFRFDYSEWTDVPWVDQKSKLSCGHGVPAVDYMMFQGTKALLIEDSWGPNYGKGGNRIITEEFLKARCFYAGYVTSLPNFIFSKTLRYGDKGLEVKMLQQVLNRQGYILTPDGKFGKMTQGAVMNFQKKHSLDADGIVGPKTRAVLNSL